MKLVKDDFKMEAHLIYIEDKKLKLVENVLQKPDDTTEYQSMILADLKDY